MSESWLVWGLLFGSIGLGYVIYGRRQKSVVAFVCGLGLMAFPYFVSSTFALVLVGLVLLALPFVIEL